VTNAGPEDSVPPAASGGGGAGLRPAGAAPRGRQIHIGCSGWNYAHWRNGVFYPSRLPASKWLEHYTRSFDTVEVNATFYRLPKRSSVARWVEQSPPGFVFAIKASRYLTHIKRLTDLGPGLERFYACVEPLLNSPKLGPILWQLPPNFKRDEERLATALERLSGAQRHCFEFREASWFHPDVYALLREHRVALVIGDRPEVHSFQSHELTTDFTFVRFHSGTRGARGNYSESELEEWAQRFDEWARRAEIWAYFNNDWEGFAPRNALWLKKRLRA
jgi:uncharacterized protein YecE (DUF72 family)